MKTKHLYMISPKGGTGKSYITLHLAIELQRMNHRVLLIDADLTNPSLNTLMRLKENRPAKLILKEKASPLSLIQRGMDGVDLFCNLYPLGFQDYSQNQIMQLFFDLHRSVTEYYDYVLWDIPLDYIQYSGIPLRKKDSFIQFSRPEDIPACKGFSETFHRWHLKSPLFNILNMVESPQKDQSLFDEVEGQYLGYIFKDEEGVNESIKKEIPLQYCEIHSPILDCLQLILESFLGYKGH